MGLFDSTSDKTSTDYSNTVQQSNSTSAPWAPQQQEIKGAMQNADNLYYSNGFNPGYTGQMLAGPTQLQYDANNQAYNNAQWGGQGAVNNILQGTSGSLASGNGYQGNAANVLSNYANTDQTGNTINAANQYANNPYISQMVQAGMQDAIQTASDSTLPNMYRAAAGGNALNSDRAALAQGVVDRGLAQSALNLSGSLRGQAWSSGLSAAQQAQQMQLGAANSLGSLGGNMVNQGITGQSAGINMQGVVDNQAATAANNIQSLNQIQNTNDYYNYQNSLAGQQQQWQALQNYANIVAGRNFGTTNNSTSTTGVQSYGDQQTENDPSLFSDIGSIASGVGSLIKK